MNSIFDSDVCVCVAHDPCKPRTEAYHNPSWERYLDYKFSPDPGHWLPDEHWSTAGADLLQTTSLRLTLSGLCYCKK